MLTKHESERKKYFGMPLHQKSKQIYNLKNRIFIKTYYTDSQDLAVKIRTDVCDVECFESNEIPKVMY